MTHGILDLTSLQLKSMNKFLLNFREVYEEMKNADDYIASLDLAQFEEQEFFGFKWTKQNLQKYKEENEEALKKLTAAIDANEVCLQLEIPR